MSHPRSVLLTTAESQAAIHTWLSAQTGWVPSSHVYHWARRELGLSTGQVHGDLVTMLHDGRIERRLLADRPAPTGGGHESRTWAELRAIGGPS